MRRVTMVLTTMAVVMSMSVGAVAQTLAQAVAQRPVEPVYAGETKKMANQTLGVLGLVTTVAGLALMVPWPEGEDWSINGTSYCDKSEYSSKTVDIQRGACDTFDPMIKAGAITAAVGGAMMLFGFRTVTVKPQVSREVVGANVTVKW